MIFSVRRSFFPPRRTVLRKKMQILVTDADFSSQSRRRNLHQTVEQLLALKVLPILNENDVITPRTTALVDEQKKVFWDNVGVFRPV